MKNVRRLLDASGRGGGLLLRGPAVARSEQFLDSGLMDTFKWLRVVGDTLFAIGTITLSWFVLGLKTGWSLVPEDAPTK